CSGFVDFANLDLTAAAVPKDLPAVLPLWSDLSFQRAGADAIYYQTLGSSGSRRFVVQWNTAYPVGSANPVIFELILSEADNSVRFQYKSVNAGGGADPSS